MSTSRRPFGVRRLGAVIACGALAASVLAVTPAYAAYRQTYQFVSKNSATQGGAAIQPYGIGIGADDSIFLSTNANYAAKLAPDFSLDTLLGLGNNHIWDPVSVTPFDQVRGIAVTGSNVWALDYSNGAALFSDAGIFSGTTILSAATSLTNPNAIAANGSAVYIADAGSGDAYQHRVSRFSTTGSYLNLHFGDTGSVEGNWMQDVHGLAIAPDSTVFAADEGAGKIWRYRPSASGLSMTQLSTWSNDTLFAEPRGVAATPDGSLFVLDADSATVTKLDPTGKVLAHWGGFGVANGMFGNPMGIAVGTTGTVYVTDRDAQVVHVFVPLDLGPTTAAAGTVTVKKGKTASFKYMASDDFSNSCNVTIKIYKGSSLKKTIAVGKVSQGSWHTKTWKDTLAKGSYTWKVYASDLTGHSQRNIASKTFKVK
jgi:streptogramin lyase